MPWCGYDPDMEAGIRQFGEGLVAAITARHEKLGISEWNLAIAEQAELELFLLALGQLPDDNPRKIALEGLTKFVLGVVQGAYDQMDHEGVGFFENLREEIDIIAGLIQPLEKTFQHANPGPNATEEQTLEQMRIVADWVNEQ